MLLINPTLFQPTKAHSIFLKRLFIMHRLFVCSFAIALYLLPSTTALFRLEHNHWNELRGLKLNNSQNPSAPQNTNFSQNQKSNLPIVIDTFQNPSRNDLGFWHGSGENLSLQHGPGFIRLFPTDPDQNFHTQFDSNLCYSLIPWYNEFLHVIFEGTDQYSVSLNQHNDECNPHRSPFPSVADSVQAERYVIHPSSEISGGDGDWDEDDEWDDDWDSDDDVDTDTRDKKRRMHGRTRGSQRKYSSARVRIPPGRRELYIPLTHFEIDFNRVVSVSFHGFFTQEPITLHRVEIVPSVPAPTPDNGHFRLPGKLPSGRLVLRCSRPNSFAFGIDDGQPQFSQRVMRILEEENVRVTFFVVGAGLRDRSSNFTAFYKEMLKRGHQIALHSNTHPK
jgi:hypothetical protein